MTSVGGWVSGCTLHTILTYDDIPVFAGRADDKRLVQIPVISLVKHADVNVDDVAVLELPPVRDAVADDLVHARAHRLWKVVVMQRRRIRSVLDTRLVHNLIDMVGRDADVDGGVGTVEDQPPDPARLPDARLALRTRGPLDDTRGAREQVLRRTDLRGGNAGGIVIRLWYVVREHAVGSDPVRPEGACPFEAGTADVPSRPALCNVVPRVRPRPVDLLMLLPHVLHT